MATHTDELRAVLRDIAMGAEMMLQPGVATGAFAGYAREVKRVAETALANAEIHERATTGKDRRHWSEVEVIGAEDLS